MGQFIFGIMAGYLAFSDAGKHLQRTLMSNVGNAIKESDTSDRHEGLDNNASIPKRAKSSASGSDVSP